MEKDKSKSIMLLIIIILIILLIISISIILNNSSIHSASAILSDENNVLSNNTISGDENDAFSNNTISSDENDAFSNDNTILNNENDTFSSADNFKETEEVIIETYPVRIKLDLVPNIFFSKYDLKVKFNNEEKRLAHGVDTELEYELESGTYDIVFESADDSSIKGVENITITGETEISYKLFCYSNEITIDTLYIENKGDVSEDETMVPISSKDCKYKNYKSIEKDFKDAGFSNITYNILYDIIWGLTSEEEVDSISINDNTSFERGNIYRKDAKIVITYHMKEENNPNKVVTSNDDKKENKDIENSKKKNVEEKSSNALSYSTNDRETAKNGNSGIFSYKNRGKNYNTYWIINFDEGYTYTFNEGNGEDTCDKIKIDSGTLNDFVKITWHDGNDIWSYGLHFRWAKQPDHLIVEDNDHFTYDYYETNLQDALNLMNKKRIVNY